MRTRFIFIPQLTAKEVKAVIQTHVYRLYPNVEKTIVSRWHYGIYYGYGQHDLWIPLNYGGGIATKAFAGHTVRFPKPINTALLKLLEAKRLHDHAAFKEQRKASLKAARIASRLEKGKQEQS